MIKHATEYILVCKHNFAPSSLKTCYTCMHTAYRRFINILQAQTCLPNSQAHVNSNRYINLSRKPSRYTSVTRKMCATQHASNSLYWDGTKLAILLNQIYFGATHINLEDYILISEPYTTTHHQSITTHHLQPIANRHLRLTATHH